VIHRTAHLQSQRDQPLLGTVAQVTLDAAAIAVAAKSANSATRPSVPQKAPTATDLRHRPAI
jgi:hypothetical protein